jgi:ketosteroid isomerase-like protein
MKPIAIIVAVLLLAACQGPGARSTEEEANLAAVKRYDELLNQHTPREDYYDDFYAADYVLTGFTSVPPFRFSLPLEQLKKMDDRAHGRRVETHLLMADGAAVVQEKVVTSSGREIREVSIRIFQDGKIAESRNYSVFLPLEGESLHRTPLERANEDAARRWVELFNTGTEDWWDEVYTPDVTWESYGSSYQSRKGEDFKALVAQAREVFPNRAFEVISLSADGDRVILETRWTGTAARPFLRFEPGDRRTSRNILFLTYREGKIAAVTTYVAGETIEAPSSSTAEQG